jgi:tartrate dehydratase beta subunit/fumarate hydratase class I family protein
MIMFHIAGLFLASYDYSNDVKSRQAISELTLYNKMASFVVKCYPLLVYQDVDGTKYAADLLAGK